MAEAMMNTNELKLGGVLISKRVSLGKTGAGKEFASVTLGIEVGENQRVDLEIFSMKNTSSGAESKIYQNLMTIKDEYKSLDSQFIDRRGSKDAQPKKLEATTVATKDECDFVFANKGIKLTNNRYMNANGELVTTFRLTTNFVNRAKEGANREPYLEGNLYGVCENDAEKIMNNEGDIVGLKLNFLVPEFRKGYTNAFGDQVADSVAVERFELVLRELGDGALEYCEEIFVKNGVCCIGVEPMVRVEQEMVKKEPTEKRGFGKIASFEPTTKTTREIRIVGGFDLQEDEYENDPNFNFELFQEGIKALDSKIEEMKEGQGKTVEVSRGFGRGGSSSGGSRNTGLPF